MHQYCGRALVVALALASASVISLSPVGAQTPADNTKVNKQDRQADATTADQQKENTHDRTLTQKIRQSIMSDKALSTYAHNVKVVSQGGQVTLKGRR
jgi:hyperosmotically inducible protein